MVRWPLCILFATVLLALLPRLWPCPPELLDPPPRSVRYLDRNGVLLRDIPIRGEHEWRVSLSDVSPYFIFAILHAEDRRFYLHPGVDPFAIARALWQDLRAGRVVSGGSTITQQYVRNVIPTGHTVLCKLKEAFLALVIETRLPKDEILEHYLNVLPYGHNLRGVQAAARFYLGKDARQLNATEAAVLAVVPRAPSGLNPLDHLDHLLALARPLLYQMYDDGLLDATGFAAALAFRPTFRPPAPPFEAPHATTRLHADSPPTSHTVKTTIDAQIQHLAEGALRAHLKALGREDVENGAIVVADTQAGEVLALVGSRDFFDPLAGQVDGTNALRQPGSTLKPFLYAMALLKGYTPASLLEDEPVTFTENDGQAWSPKDHDRRFRGLVRLREALASSLNVPATRLLKEVGVPAFVDLLHALGFDYLDRSEDEYGLGLVLGDAPVRLATLVEAYATLGRMGLWRPLTLYGDQAPAPGRRVFSAQVAYLISDILADDQARALSFGRHGVLELPFPVAVKTGTSSDHKDSWCVGYTPEFTVGVWVGNMPGGSMDGVWGAQGAAPVFRQVMLGLARHRKPTWFAEPPGLVRHRVCTASGGLAGPTCPGTVVELFEASGPQPGPCPLHGGQRMSRLRIVRPADGEVYRRDPDTPDAFSGIPLLAEGDQGPAHFIIDGAKGPVCQVGKTCRWPLQVGEHVLGLEGSTSIVRITVQ